MEDNEVNDFIDLLANVHSKIASIFINLTKYDALPRCVWDFEENFIYVNDSFAECFGYTSAEMNGQPFTKFIYREDIDKSLDVYRENIGTEKIQIFTDFTNRYIHKNGQIVTVKWIKGFNDHENRLGSGQIKIVK